MPAAASAAPPAASCGLRRQRLSGPRLILAALLGLQSISLVQGFECTRKVAGPNCSKCNAAGACVACYDEFRLVDGKCKQCPSGCVSCHPDGACNTCPAGFSLVGPKCVKCSDRFCDGCPNDPHKCKWCFTSTADFKLNFTGPVDYPLYMDPAGRCRLCKAPGRGCRACNRSGKCTSCDFGLNLVDGACVKPTVACPKLCWGCGPDGSCISGCKTGAVLVGKACVACASSPWCATCDAPGSCKTCMDATWDNSWYRGNVSYPVYRNAAGVCALCKKHSTDSGCLKCGSSGECSECSQGFVLIDGGCRKCRGRNCECGVNLKCTTCFPNFGRNATTGKCDRCQNSMCRTCYEDNAQCTECYGWAYFNKNKQCKQCLRSHCNYCDTDGSCKECLPTFGLVKGSCVLCGANCNACGADTSCSECEDQLGLLPDGSCALCMDPRCKSCNGDRSVCQTCMLAGHVVDAATGRCGKPAAASASGRAADAGQPTARRLLEEEVHAAVVGGDNAKRGRYPWFASLRLRVKGVKARPHFCGGSLIHPRVVLTAAHCMIGAGDIWRNSGYVFPQVRLGSYDSAGGQYEARRGVWPLVHERFNGTSMENDVALILLDKQSTATPVRLAASMCKPVAGSPSRAAPACQKPDRPLPAEVAVCAIGLGNLRTGGPTAAVLQEVELDLLPLNSCKKSYPDVAWRTTSMICAGDPKLHKDTCQGDSGGPLFRKGATASQDVQVGLTSWGDLCAWFTPGVYTDVAFVRDWIDQGVQTLLADPAAKALSSEASWRKLPPRST